MEKRLVLFIDSGDTLVDEGTQVWDPRGIVLKADLIPGAKETLEQIHAMGYTIALVADGEDESFNNVFSQHGLKTCFDAWAVSGLLGVVKPDRKMFQTALDQLHLSDVDKGRIVMVGNNVERDVPGANRFGIVSILIDWSPRYSYTPKGPDTMPDYTIHSPGELLPLLERLEQDLEQGRSIKKKTP